MSESFPEMFVGVWISENYTKHSLFVVQVSYIRQSYLVPYKLMERKGISVDREIGPRCGMSLSESDLDVELALDQGIGPRSGKRPSIRDQTSI